MQENLISSALKNMAPELVNEIMENATIKEIPSDTLILNEGQYVKVIPIVLEGLLRVFGRYGDKEFLLYYIRPNESCIMSFAASRQNEPSKIMARTEEDTKILLLPVSQVPSWRKRFPDFNALFFQQYDLRYSELLNSIHHILFDRLDKRLYDLLVQKSQIANKKEIKISHRQLANDLGTAREVVSRTVKKLENQGKVKQNSQGIEVLDL